MYLIPPLIQAVVITIISLLTPQIPPAIPADTHIVISPTPKLYGVDAKMIFGPFLDTEVDSTSAAELTKPSHTTKPTAPPQPKAGPPLADIPTKKSSPTIKPTSTPAPSPAPTYKLSPVIPGLPTQITQPTAGDHDAEYIFTKVNLHRASIGLAAYEKEDQLCSLASARAPEIYDEIFTTEQYHAGLRDRQLPFWITENIGSFRTEDEMIAWWLSDYIHRIAIEGNYKYSCAACQDKSCTQLFTSFVPK